MLRLAIVDQNEKIVELKDVPTAAELLVLAQQARSVIRDCERLAQPVQPKGATLGKVPYAT